MFYFTSKLLVKWKSLEGSDSQVAFERENERRGRRTPCCSSLLSAAADDDDDDDDDEDDECARAREEKSPSHRFRPVFLKQRIMKKL